MENEKTTVQSELDQELVNACATSGSSTRVIKVLRAGANPNHRPEFGAPAMSYAARSGKTDALRAMLEAGGSQDQQDEDGWPLIMQAVERGHWQIARLLNEFGADIESASPMGNRAVHMVRFGLDEARAAEGVKMMVFEFGADPNALGDDGSNLLGNLCKAVFQKELSSKALVELIADLVRAGADPWAGEPGRSAMDRACQAHGLWEGKARTLLSSARAEFERAGLDQASAVPLPRDVQPVPRL